MLGLLKNTCPHLFIGFLAFSMLILSSCVEKQRENTLIINMSYHEARPIIIESGWQPTQAKRSDMDAEYYLPHFYYDAGYTEVIACSGTGLGYCTFKFKNEKGEYLRVTTQGGDYTPNDTHPPIVISVSLSDDFE